MKSVMDNIPEGKQISPDKITAEELQESHKFSSEADTIIGFVSQKKPWYKRFFYNIYRSFYILFNGHYPEVAKEINRIDQAIEKVKNRQYFLTKDFKNNRNELFQLLDAYSKLVNYKCELTNYWDNSGIVRCPVFTEAGDSKLVDEILDYKWYLQ